MEKVSGSSPGRVNIFFCQFLGRFFRTVFAPRALKNGENTVRKIVRKNKKYNVENATIFRKVFAPPRTMWSRKKT